MYKYHSSDIIIIATKYIYIYTHMYTHIYIYIYICDLRRPGRPRQEGQQGLAS